MPTVHISRTVPIIHSPRVLQLCGMFDVPPAKQSEVRWAAHLPFDARHWNIGLIVGPSGCGKSTLAREIFGPALVDGYDWPADRSIVDAFPAGMGIKEITGLLSSVGFSSPPSWLRPFRVLSNGEQFRATIARTLAERPELSVVDEFTSVVDRTVAKVGSAAIAKAVRRRGQRFVAVACHYDIVDWLDPDWVYEPATDEFQWRCERLRPEIRLAITAVPRDAWRLFKQHHYLSGGLSCTARCFLAAVEGRPAAFVAVIGFPHPQRPGWREHRTVCLPDFQGVGIGNAVSEFVASLYAASGRPYFSTTSHPAMIRHRVRSSLWRMTRPPSRSATAKENHRRATINRLRATAATNRITAGFEYIGAARRDEASAFGLRVSEVR